MSQPQPEPETTSAVLLSGRVSRRDLARAPSVTVAPLGRWKARRFGPACVRAGRMVLYRRRAVQGWPGAQEMPRAKAVGGRK